MDKLEDLNGEIKTFEQAVTLAEKALKEGNVEHATAGQLIGTMKVWFTTLAPKLDGASEFTWEGEASDPKYEGVRNLQTRIRVVIAGLHAIQQQNVQQSRPAKTEARVRIAKEYKQFTSVERPFGLLRTSCVAIYKAQQDKNRLLHDADGARIERPSWINKILDEMAIIIGVFKNLDMISIEDLQGSNTKKYSLQSFFDLKKTEVLRLEFNPSRDAWHDTAIALASVAKQENVVSSLEL